MMAAASVGDRRSDRSTMRSSRRRSGPVAVRIRGLTKHFGTGEQRVQALRGVDWDVYTGQMTLIVGPSGCGKTTLLSVIAGILDGDAGDGEHLRPRADGDERPGADAASGPGTSASSSSSTTCCRRSTAAENAAIPLVIAGWSQRAGGPPGRRGPATRSGMGKKLDEPAQPALGRPDAAGRDRPGPGPRAAPPGLRRADRRARPRDRASPSWSCSARRPSGPTGPSSS